jgi:hypothetical protein
MNSKSARGLLSAVGCVLMSGSVLAHHGDAGRYDEEAFTLTGTVVQLVLVNPHALIMLDVTENGKTTRWTAEMGAPQQLARNFGWTPATVTIGTRLTLIGRRVRTGAPYMNLTEHANIVLTDSGKEIFRTPNFGEPATPPTPTPPSTPAVQP